ncbi:MAG: hypothetical protein ACREJC_19115 [Tepidisphaeraceae bacterium]
MQKLLVMAALVAACGGTGTSTDCCEADAGVDAGGCDADCDDAMPASVCGDGACAADEDPTSCAADCTAGGPVCGDGTCEGTETPGNCASDCGAAVCTAANDTCTGSTICVSGACVAAFPRTYVITNVVVAAIPGAYDPDNSGPDLFISDDNGAMKWTAVQPDTLTATFPGPIERMLTEGLQFRVYAWDDDPPNSRMVAFACQWPLFASTLRPRTLSCAYNGGSMSFSINPK